MHDPHVIVEKSASFSDVMRERGEGGRKREREAERMGHGERGGRERGWGGGREEEMNILCTKRNAYV